MVNEITKLMQNKQTSQKNIFYTLKLVRKISSLNNYFEELISQLDCFMLKHNNESKLNNKLENGEKDVIPI